MERRRPRWWLPTGGWLVGATRVGMRGDGVVTNLVPMAKGGGGKATATYRPFASSVAARRRLNPVQCDGRCNRRVVCGRAERTTARAEVSSGTAI